MAHTTIFSSLCYAEMLESRFLLLSFLFLQKKKIIDNVLGRVGWGVVGWFLYLCPSVLGFWSL